MKKKLNCFTVGWVGGGWRWPLWSFSEHLIHRIHSSLTNITSLHKASSKNTWVISLGRWKWVEILISDIDPRILLVCPTIAVSHIDLKLVLVACVGLGEHHPQHNTGVAHLTKVRTLLWKSFTLWTSRFILFPCLFLRLFEVSSTGDCVFVSLT